MANKKLKTGEPESICGSLAKSFMSLPAVNESPFEEITTARIPKSDAASFILFAKV